METCIYLFSKKPELTYKTQEHVITAGIGGRRTLPKGYVSDQANEMFSKFELMCLRYSPLQIERARFGPGKRGSNNISDIDSPDVLSLEPVIEGSNQNYVCPLGFVFQNQAYLIPQLIFLFDDTTKDFDVTHLRSDFQASGNIDASEFHRRLNEFLKSSNRVYKTIEVPYDTNCHFVCVGCYKRTWYISSTQSDFIIDNWANRFLEKEIINDLPIYSETYSEKYTFKFTRVIELEYMVPVFIHAKNCFNTLALFKGCEFVQQNIFDRFRQCILTNSGWGTVTMPSSLVPRNIALWLTEKIQDHEHAVVIYTENETVLAFSVLYGKSWGLFKLGTKYMGEPFVRAVICDYKNRKEIWYDSEASFEFSN